MIWTGWVFLAFETIQHRNLFITQEGDRAQSDTTLVRDEPQGPKKMAESVGSQVFVAESANQKIMACFEETMLINVNHVWYPLNWDIFSHLLRFQENPHNQDAPSPSHVALPTHGRFSKAQLRLGPPHSLPHTPNLMGSHHVHP